MRQRSFILVAVVIAVLLLGAVGVYAYAKTQDNVIAQGVTAGGVDLGGMHRDKARQALDRELTASLTRPVVVTYGGHHFTLSGSRARVRVDTDRMVQDALDA